MRSIGLAKKDQEKLFYLLDRRFLMGDPMLLAPIYEKGAKLTLPESDLKLIPSALEIGIQE